MGFWLFRLPFTQLSGHPRAHTPASDVEKQFSMNLEWLSISCRELPVVVKRYIYIYIYSCREYAECPLEFTAILFCSE